MLTASVAPDDERRNFFHLYADVFWYGVLAGSALAFLPVFAARLGASGLQVGLLTAAPAILNLIVSLPAGRWLEGRPLIGATFSTSLWHRSGYLLLVVLPWVLPNAGQVSAMLVIVAAMSIPGAVLAIAFNAMFADVVPPGQRAQVVGRRSALLAVSLTATSLISGWLLDILPFPLNYQIIFVVGTVGAVLSSYHLGKLYRPADAPPPERVGKPIQDIARPGLLRFADAFRMAPGLRFLTRSEGKPLLRLDILRGSFGLFLLSYLIFYTCQYVPIPLVPLYWVNELQLTDGMISLGSALFYLIMMLGSLGLRRVVAKFGHKRVLAFGTMFYCLYPLMHGLATDATLYWVSSFIGGGVWALVNAGLVNRLMERVPNDDRPAHMAMHNIVLNVGILGGSLIGPAMGDALGLRNALIGAGILRFMAGLLIAVWG